MSAPVTNAFIKVKAAAVDTSHGQNELFCLIRADTVASVTPAQMPKCCNVSLSTGEKLLVYSSINNFGKLLAAAGNSVFDDGGPVAWISDYPPSFATAADSPRA